MDLFSKFPESETQGQLLSNINEEKTESMEIDINESKEDHKFQNTLKFENLQKVNSIRKRSILLISILFLLSILFSYIIRHYLINISLYLIENYSIKDKFAQKIFSYLNDICIVASYCFMIILYFNYSLNFSFIYILSLIISKYVSCLIFITYGIDREKDKSLRDFFENTSEKPNVHLLRTVIIFFGFWRLLISKGRNKKEINRYKKINSILFLISVFITTIIFLEQIFVEKCSVKSCFLGLFIGFILYSIIYEIICIQFMKPNFFMHYIHRNYWLFVFLSIIPLGFIIYMFNNYNGIEDVLEIYTYIPFYGISNISHIDQDNMNRICLQNSLVTFLLIFIIHGIEKNFDFVSSKNNNYNLSNIVLFNQSIKTKMIIRHTFIYMFLGVALIALKIYINYYYPIPLIYYLIIEIAIYFIFGEGFFGKGIKSMLKPNVNEEKELEDYQGIELSGGSTPGIENVETGRI